MSNLTTDFERIAVNIGSAEKKRFLNIINKKGTSVSFVIRKLVGMYIDGKVKLD